MLVAKQAVELYFIRNDTPISFRMFFIYGGLFFILHNLFKLIHYSQ